MSSYRMSASGTDRSETITRGHGAVSISYGSKPGDEASVNLGSFATIEIVLPQADEELDSGSYLELRQTKDGTLYNVLVIKGVMRDPRGDEIGLQRSTTAISIYAKPADDESWPNVSVDVRKKQERYPLGYLGDTVSSTPIKSPATVD